MKKILFLEHIPFETPALLLDWAKEQKIEYERFYFYDQKRSSLPSPDEFDLLVIMGGPMNIYEENIYPWLKEEKEFIKQCILKNKKILGLCLGAQLIASCLGAKIIKNNFQEIGFFPLDLSKEGEESFLFKGFPTQFYAVHWHGDTFELPKGAELLCSSEACKNQAFLFQKNILALQFHLELKYESLETLCKNDPPQISQFVQSENEILNKKNLIYLEKTKELLNIMMKNFLKI